MFHPVRVLLLNDEPVVRTTLRRLLATTVDLLLVGETANLAALAVLPAQTQADILLVGSGDAALLYEVALITQLQVRIVALLQPSDATPLLLPMVAGCCLTTEITHVLSHLLRAVAAGATLISGGVAAQWPVSSQLPPRALALATLTPREQQVYLLLGYGWHNEQIAAHLHCGKQTVRNYTSHIYKKLGIDRLAVEAHFQNNLNNT